MNAGIGGSQTRVAEQFVKQTTQTQQKATVVAEIFPNTV